MPLKAKTVHYHEVMAHDWDAFIREFYGVTDYAFYTNECGAREFQFCPGTGPVSESTTRIVASFRENNGQKPMAMAQFLLEDLIKNGHIEHGEYRIKVF